MPLPQELLQPFLAVVLWRQRPERARELEVQFLALCDQYHNLEVWSGSKASSVLPSVQGGALEIDFAQAAELARRVRRELALGDRPGLTLLRVLEEDIGLKIFHLDFEPAGTAACALGESFGPSILLNARNVRWRRNFDLAHELFHLLTWSPFDPLVEHGGVRSAKEERLADCFASNLLMPEEAVRSAVTGRRHDGKVPIAGLFDIARQFDVSVEALLWRVHWLFRSKAEKALTERDIERAKASAKLYEKREPATPDVRPARFRALAISALRQGEISIGRFAEYMGISRREAMEFSDSEQAGDEEIELASA